MQTDEAHEIIQDKKGKNGKKLISIKNVTKKKNKLRNKQ